MECWYVDFSQCISLSTKEHNEILDLKDLSVGTHIRPLFGGYTTDTLKETEDKHYNRLFYVQFQFDCLGHVVIHVDELCCDPVRR